jgi:hypothetical protein
LKELDTDIQERQQDVMATALLLGTQINEHCFSVADVEAVFAALSRILVIRFGVTCHVSFEESHK